jgi:protein phosphatase/serine/threonine-protein phosphatase Stp1
MILAPVVPELVSAGRFRSSAATHAGAVRSRNEDNYVNRPDLGLWAVADGAGGHQAGDVAARTVAEALDALPKGLGAAEKLAGVRVRVEQADAVLRAEAARRGGDAVLATTVVVLLAHADYYACLWAGDSRAYRLRAGQLAQVTHDHSLVQELVDAGEITAAEAETHPCANIITRAVGAGGEALALDKVTGRLQAGDRFLLCSDGLFKALHHHELAGLLAADADAAERCLTAALARQADDNVTAVVVEVLPGPLR